MVRRVNLPDESESGWSFDPSSVDHVIEAHLRRHGTHARQSGTKTAQKSSLGLSEVELKAIWQEGGAIFLESASLSEELRNRRASFRETWEKRLDRLLKMPQMHRDQEYTREAELQAVAFAHGCAKAISRTTGHFADMLAQAVIGRLGHKDLSLQLRADLWRECLQFAKRLAGFEIAGQWVDRAWGSSVRESVMPHLHRLDTIQEQQAEWAKFTTRFKSKFDERIRRGSPEWLNEAERRINLRLLLSHTPHRRAKLDDPSKQAMGILLTVRPRLTTQQVCNKLDAQNERTPGSAPILESWRMRGARSWSDALDKLPAAVKTFISKVKSAVVT